MADFLTKLTRAVKRPSRLFNRLQRLLRPAKPRLTLLRQMPRGVICAEIGVWKGEFSEQILSITHPAKVHLVDPWAFAPHYPRRMYGGSRAKCQRDMDTIANGVARKFGLDDRVVIHRMASQRFFAQAIPLDWVYIDGDHSQDAVLADLRAAWRAVRPGGFIAGDDYLLRDADGSLPIKLALEQFSREAGVDFRLIGNQFVIAKPPPAFV